MLRAVLCGVLLALACAGCRAARPVVVKGELVEIRGLRVLRVWGTAENRGYAHGYLLAPEIVGLFEREVLTLPQCRGGGYEARVLPEVLRRFEWGADVEAELAWMWRGMAERMQRAGGLRVVSLDRDMTVDDLKAMNALADWHRFGCSSFTVRPSSCEGGRPFTARNLDFPLRSESVAAQIVHAVYPLDGKPAWATVTWPGSVGAYTGMSGRGVVACMHDADNSVKAASGTATPRGVVLRRVLETASPGAACAGGILGLVGERPWMGGNIVHVAWRSAEGSADVVPAASYECDAGNAAGRHATIRAPAPGDAALVSTNHFREREKPAPCQRYDRIAEGIEYYAKRGEPLSVERARRILRAAEQPTSVLSAYIFPDELMLYVSIGRTGIPSPRVPPVKLTWAELFPSRQ